MTQRNNRTAELAKAANAMQDSQARSLDALTEYETFREMFLPEIRSALVKGMTANQIMEHFKPIVAARLVQIAGTGSETAAITAIRDIFNRLEGTPVAREEHIHRLGKISEAELDAVLLSKLNKTKVIETIAASVSEAPEEEPDETK